MAVPLISRPFYRAEALGSLGKAANNYEFRFLYIGTKIRGIHNATAPLRENGLSGLKFEFAWIGRGACSVNVFRGM